MTIKIISPNNNNISRCARGIEWVFKNIDKTGISITASPNNTDPITPNIKIKLLPIGIVNADFFSLLQLNA